MSLTGGRGTEKVPHPATDLEGPEKVPHPAIDPGELKKSLTLPLTGRRGGLEKSLVLLWTWGELKKSLLLTLPRETEKVPPPAIDLGELKKSLLLPMSQGN